MAMLQKEGLIQVLRFVSKRWNDIAGDPQNRVMATLPDTFWMNSVGGRAGKGRWVTVLMYTESEEDAEAFKEVLLRWQSKGARKPAGADLIQIGKRSATDNESES